MEVYFHRNFKKRYKTVPVKIRKQFEKRLELFLENVYEPLLNIHPLTGDRNGEWSMNVTGDWRAIYIIVDDHSYMFIDLDTHSNLYR